MRTIRCELRRQNWLCEYYVSVKSNKVWWKNKCWNNTGQAAGQPGIQHNTAIRLEDALYSDYADGGWEERGVQG